MDINKGITLLFIASMVLTAPVLSGCAPKLGGTDYAAAGAQGAYDIEYGTVIAVRTVKINNDGHTTNTMGAVGGGVVGGVVGNMFGAGKGNTLATLGGALAGAALGEKGAQALGGQTGVEVTIRLDSGRDMAVVQGSDLSFASGQRVKVLHGEGTTRVVPE